MADIISAELRNRLFKMGVVNKASAGAVIEGNIGPLNTTLVNSLGREIQITRNKDAFNFVDKEIKQVIDDYLLENGKLRFKSLGEFIDRTTGTNMARQKEGITASINNMGENFRFILSTVTGDPSFLTRPFRDVVNCIEYATFVSVVSKIYFPETKVRVLMFASNQEKEKGITGAAQKLLDRHAYFIFKDKDGKEYLSIFGQKVRPIDEAIDLLQKMHDRAEARFFHVPDLIKKIQAERRKL